MICSICLASLPVQRVPVLLYADDLTMVPTSPEGLQAQLDLLHAYAAKWKLTVVIDKTKAVAFRQTSTNQVYPPPIYNGASIEVVESFKYLGVEYIAPNHLLQKLYLVLRLESGHNLPYSLAALSLVLTILP